MSMKPQDFIPVRIGTVVLANGRSFAIDQVKKSGACRIINHNERKVNFSHSIANAYKSVLFQGKVDHKTQNTSEWNDEPYHRSRDW